MLNRVKIIDSLQHDCSYCSLALNHWYIVLRVFSATSRNRFSYEISDRLGRSRNKEQYAYIYRYCAHRTTMVSPEESFLRWNLAASARREL